MSDKVYDRAWKLLCDPSRWCKDWFAKDCHGKDVCHDDPAAVRWCAYGAIEKVYEDILPQTDKLEYYLWHNHIGAISDWNDSSDHQTVIRVLRELDI